MDDNSDKIENFPLFPDAVIFMIEINLATLYHNSKSYFIGHEFEGQKPKLQIAPGMVN